MLEIVNEVIDMPGGVYGCTDMDACNYNADATADDGSCDLIGTECSNNTYECDASDCPTQHFISIVEDFAQPTGVGFFSLCIDNLSRRNCHMATC